MRHHEALAVALEAIDQRPAARDQALPERERGLRVAPLPARARTLAPLHCLSQPRAGPRARGGARGIEELRARVEHRFSLARGRGRLEGEAQAQPGPEVCGDAPEAQQLERGHLAPSGQRRADHDAAPRGRRRNQAEHVGEASSGSALDNLLLTGMRREEPALGERATRRWVGGEVSQHRLVCRGEHAAREALEARIGARDLEGIHPEAARRQRVDPGGEASALIEQGHARLEHAAKPARQVAVQVVGGFREAHPVAHATSLPGLARLRTRGRRARRGWRLPSGLPTNSRGCARLLPARAAP